MVFGIYALAMLAALLTCGALSDHLGRRPVLLGALAAQAVTMGIYATAHGVGDLLLARVVQGLSTGAAIGAVGAGLLDLDRPRGTVANAVAPMTGTALGGIGAGLLVQFLPAPTRLVYVLLGALFVIQALGVALMAETAAPRPGALASLRLRFALPAAARGPLLVAVPVLVAGWALAGFHGSLGPALVRQLSGSHAALLGGLPLFLLAGSGALGVLLLHGTAPRRLMLLGSGGLLLGAGMLLLAVLGSSAALLFLGTAVAGVGFGAGFQGAIRTLLPLAAPHERAGLLSVVFVVSYLAMGLPAVGAGLLVHGGGLIGTAWHYMAVVVVLAALALGGLLRRPAR